MPRSYRPRTAPWGVLITGPVRSSAAIARHPFAAFVCTPHGRAGAPFTTEHHSARRYSGARPPHWAVRATTGHFGRPFPHRTLVTAYGTAHAACRTLAPGQHRATVAAPVDEHDPKEDVEVDENGRPDLDED
jgi:hypothetical protein